MGLIPTPVWFTDQHCLSWPSVWEGGGPRSILQVREAIYLPTAPPLASSKPPPSPPFPAAAPLPPQRSGSCAARCSGGKMSQGSGGVGGDFRRPEIY